MLKQYTKYQINICKYHKKGVEN